MSQWIGVKDRRGLISSLGLLLILANCMVGAQILLERERPTTAKAEELSYLPKGNYLRVAVLGYRQIAADLLWLKAVQHLGELKQAANGYVSAYHVTDVVTDLDPKFLFAYQATGTVLSIWGERLNESIAILKKGVIHNPDDWHLPFMLGYNYFFELCDPGSAATYFRVASELPGAPTYLPKLAARMTVEAGDPAAAFEFLQRLHQQVRDERVREALENRMKEVIAEQHLQMLEEGIRQYKTRYGNTPNTIQDMERHGVIERMPTSPFGGPYEISSDGTVSVSGMNQRLRVHRARFGCQRING
jgi:tetratricopeptide (TPR) repeat protein